MFDHINEGNPSIERKTYARTLNCSVYNKLSFSLEKLDIVSGFIIDGNMFIYFDAPGSSRSEKEVHLKQLKCGKTGELWLYNLWYEPIKELKESMVLNSRKEVVERASDFFSCSQG